MSDHSTELDQLAAALVRTQAELATLTPDATGWVGPPQASDSYRYATLHRLWDAVRRPLADNGLGVAQTCEPGEAGEVRLTTWLLHTSGQWLCGTASLPPAWRGPRGYGAALSYARRYCLAAMLGLCVEDDDEAGPAAERPADNSLHRRAPKVLDCELTGGDPFGADGMSRRGDRRAARHKQRAVRDDDGGGYGTGLE
jgi:hypothetical protein